MSSNDILQSTMERVGVKYIAHELGVSQSLVYKWTQDKNVSGTTNPLERIREIIDITKDSQMLDWLCSEFSGVFVPDVSCDNELELEKYMLHYQKLLINFNELSTIILESIIDDQKIDAKEYDKIRKKWYCVKQYVEGFINHCQRWSEATSK